MRVYRIASRKYATDLTGVGASITGGRWNSKGKNILYTSSTRALAMLEVLVHVSSEFPIAGFELVEIEIPDDLIITNIDPSILPKNWNNYESNDFTKSLGDNWLENNVAIALMVPSIISPDEFNVLINPKNSGFYRVKVISTSPLILDNRLVKKEKGLLKTDPVIQKRLNQISKFRYDVFISHASEDKDEVVLPIVREINKFGLRYWFDNDQLKLGDSITGKISDGIRDSRFVLVIISGEFVKKSWTMIELQTALNMQLTSGMKKVLPVLVVRNNDREWILDKLSLIRDLFYVVWEGNPAYIVDLIVERLSVE